MVKDLPDFVIRLLLFKKILSLFEQRITKVDTKQADLIINDCSVHAV